MDGGRTTTVNYSDGPVGCCVALSGRTGCDFDVWGFTDFFEPEVKLTQLNMS